MKQTVRVQCSAEQLKALFRFEILFSSICDVKEYMYIETSQNTKITFEDIVIASGHMKDKKDCFDMIGQQWAAPLKAMGDSIGLAELMGASSMKEIHLGYVRYADALDKESAVRNLFGTLLTLRNMHDTSTSLFDYEAWYQMFRNIEMNEKLTADQWHLTELQKMAFIEKAYKEDRIDLLDEDEKKLFRRCLEEECAEDRIEAWRIKASCLAGGNTIYKADWTQALNLYESLYEEEEKNEDAFMIGWIYYHGLQYDETVDYDLAYQFFSVSAFLGNYEAMCYCADMLLKGEGVPVNITASYRLVAIAYGNTKADFTDGHVDNCFAEAAVRMGDNARFGVGDEGDAMLAYSYYLDAEAAVKLRMRIKPKRNDYALYERIEEKKKAVENELGSEVHHRQYTSELPYMIERLLNNGHELVMHVSEDKTKLMFSRTEKEKNGFILCTCENMSCACMVDQVTIEVQDMQGDLQGGSRLVIDRIAYDEDKKETIFLYQGERKASLTCSSFTLRDNRRKDWEKEEVLNFAAVSFIGEDRIYDFICPFADLKKGDHVIVDTKYGPEEAVFLWMYPARMSEMPLPDNKYRRILQKCTFHLYA